MALGELGGVGKVEERRGRVIDAIVAATTEVMAEGGAASLSLGEVARRVGMRTPSLYGYFGIRADLCDEIFRAAGSPTPTPSTTSRSLLRPTWSSSSGTPSSMGWSGPTATGRRRS